MTSESEVNSEFATRPAFQFGLRALFALPIYIAVLGAVGLPYACILLPVPAFFLLRWMGATTWDAAIPTVISCILIALFMPAVTASRPHRPRLACMNNLKQLGTALLQYEADCGSFPAPYSADKNGRPLVSWRAALMPYMEGRDIYMSCRFDQPWNSPSNSKLAGMDLRFLRCPSDPDQTASHTSYLAVVGPGTVWSVDEPVGLDDIDDPSRTILLIEVANSGICWLEPRGLSLDVALRGINSAPGASISSSHPGVVNVLFADGHTVVLPEDTSLAELRELLTVERRPAEIELIEEQLQ